MKSRSHGFAKLAMSGSEHISRGFKRMDWGARLAARSSELLKGGNIGKSIKATQTSLNAQRRGIGDVATSAIR